MYERSIRTMGFAFRTACLLAAAGLALTGLAQSGQAETGWQVQQSPERFGVAAAMPGPDGNVVSFSCTRPGAPTHTATGETIRPPAPNQLIFFVEPTQLGADTADNAQTSVTLTVDGRKIGTLTLTLALPERQLGAMIPTDNPVLALLRDATQMSLTSPRTGQHVAVPLSGFSATLDQVIARCQTPGEQPTQLAQVPPLQGKAPQAARPSFDCAKAQVAAEQAICGAPALARKDLALAQAYNQALAATKGATRKSLRETQRQWLFQRNACGVQAACLDRLMTARTTQLTAIAQGRAIPAPPPPTVTQAPKPGPLTGVPVPVKGQVWFGDIACQRLTGGEAEFTITGRNEQGQYEAVLSVSSPESLASGTSRMAYLGEDVGNGKIRFVMIRAIQPGVAGRANSGFIFTPATGEGKFDSGTCTTMSLKPQGPQSLRLVSTVPRPANGGTYFAAQTPRAKCEALIAWAGRLNTEYPDIDFYRTRNTVEFSWKKIKIFADADFVPVFGQPYDTMDYKARVGVRNFANQDCGSDPFVRGQMETFQAAASRPITGGGERRELTSDGYTSTVFAVRKLRALRNEIALIERGAVGDAMNLQQQLETLGDQLDLLWPSERKQMKESLTASIAAQAHAQAAKDVAAVLAISDPLQAVPRADAAIKRVKADYGELMKRSDLDQAVTNLKAHRDAAAEQIRAPLLQAVRATPTDLDGVSTLATQLKALPAPMKLLSSAEQSAYEAEVGKELSTRLKTLVADRVKALSSLTPDREGLTASVDWVTSFNRDFARFSDRAEISAGLKTFRDSREGLLEAALPAFEAAYTAETSAAARDDIVRAFLGWDEDETLPIFLEYELARMMAGQ